MPNIPGRISYSYLFFLPKPEVVALTLENLDLDMVREKVFAAYEADSEVIQQYREYARRLNVSA